MSSCTSFRAAPARPAPPPQVVSTVAGHQASSVSGLLGPGGCRLLRETLADLARGANSPLLREVAEGRAADDPAVRDLHGWRQDPADPTRFTRQVAGVEVAVLTGGSALETRFAVNVTAARALTEAEKTARAAEIQKQANRVVNKVLAVAVAKNVIAQKLKEKVKERVQVKAANNATVRMTCFAEIKS